MAKDKERSVNPAQQQRKLEKAKALKKSKADLQAKRNEKLARRNPTGIQRQIDDLKALETAGDLKPREKAILADLERDLKAIKKAKEALGETIPQQTPRPSHPRDTRDTGSGLLGKRRYDGQRKFNDRHDSAGSDTDESVRNIPWPRDTPPPIPREFRHTKNPNMAPLGEGRSYPLPAKLPEPKTTYESAPQIRDLKKEAISRFVPNVVKRKQDAVKGTGGQLLEPEELDRLEREGYLQSTKPTEQDDSKQHPPLIDTEEARRLKAEEEAFERELAMQDANDIERDDQGPATGTAEKSVQPGARLLPSRHVELEEVEDEDL
ncbi:hypothetical protein H2198_000271 [Neophaeococcomyces mojaviensis]|uniref:Uncharacterized protein n=1 Tax=Neophaeococcomyces mojaviensis TaxID=3383035 RepID=A0ACC3AK61_9EURO|nr:hypothetical protein H2198_000271 [Knufia sp. JES_112]